MWMSRFLRMVVVIGIESQVLSLKSQVLRIRLADRVVI
jgi:hypothetical protein